MKSKILYPDPMRIRESTNMLCENWQFSFDCESWMPINVPFCPESALSGIGYTKFITQCYYRTKFVAEQNDKDIFLYFGAVDYKAEIFLNEIKVGEHEGGYTPFSIDITQYVKKENYLMVKVSDDHKKTFPKGKQSRKLQSYGCFYTRVTGIWQPVWVEYIPKKKINNFRFSTFGNEEEVELWVNGCGKYKIKIEFNDMLEGEAEGYADRYAKIKIKLKDLYFWDIGKGNVYDVTIKFEDDVVYSYFGIRTVEYSGYKFLLNGRSVFQRLVLNQGYYFDGIYTPSSINVIESDIENIMKLGFNGVRLHEKVFAPSFLYLCDIKGCMVWEEYAGWGVDYSNLDGLKPFLREWKETLVRDINHPSIITWCPLNEVWDNMNNVNGIRDIRFIDTVYKFTKEFDKTRPCVDVSGGYHGHETDIYDFHCYEDLDTLKEYLDELQYHDKLDVKLLYSKEETLKYQKGLPVNVSECGGWGFSPVGDVICHKDVHFKEVEFTDEWGYGVGESDGDVFVQRYEDLISLLYSYSKLSGFCYTQLYDIEQEQNGFYYYNRSDKLSYEQKKKIREINMKKAEIEKD